MFVQNNTQRQNNGYIDCLLILNLKKKNLATFHDRHGYHDNENLYKEID